MGTPTKWHSSPSGLHVLSCGCAYSAEPILGIGEAKTIGRMCLGKDGAVVEIEKADESVTASDGRVPVLLYFER